jgi:fido (protein-threonine AMPylation protein)
MAEWERLPGETAIDPSWLKVRGITNRRELAVVEAENIRKATVKYFTGRLTRRKARFDFPWFLRLHRDMFGDVWSWAGQTRDRDLNFGVPWAQVDAQLYALVHDLQCWAGFGEEILVQAVRLHYQAVRIHPFHDGNGRWARMLSNLWLRLHDRPIVEWPTDVSQNESVIRREYIAAIEGGKEAELVALHRRYL